MYISALCILRTFDPALDIDVTHLLAGEERVVFQYYVVSVPDDHSQLIATSPAHTRTPAHTYTSLVHPHTQSRT